YKAHCIFRENFNPNEVQLSTLLNIKKGGCPENCSYCPQSAHFETGVAKEPLMTVDDVLVVARKAKAAGASRFCMGAAWRGPKDRDIDNVIELIKAVKAEGLETCVTLGLLKPHQAVRMKEAGLDYYNHNIDTSPDFYREIITTRDFNDRLETLEYVRQAGLNVCCGGILGMGESVKDRAEMLVTLANMPIQPRSVPINMLARVEGTPLAEMPDLDPIDFVKTIAVARIMLPKSFVRLSAGRNSMSDEMQALCIFAGANSIFYGEDVLLTTPNPIPERDQYVMEKLGLKGI
ncbi:MAG TPA: biotin synthase BioB, partial [Candidatus Nitrosotenuis sp.]|nr:biotin synthase BioB [Candidatus Nitrosotenuis sp.]